MHATASVVPRPLPMKTEKKHTKKNQNEKTTTTTFTKQICIQRYIGKTSSYRLNRTKTTLVIYLFNMMVVAAATTSGKTSNTFLMSHDYVDSLVRSAFIFANEKNRRKKK